MLFVTTFYASYALGSIFFICEVGQRVSDAFEGIDDVVMDFEWNSFPHEIQKLLPTIMIMTQKPVVMECFGSTSALRESFKKVFYQSIGFTLSINLTEYKNIFFTGYKRLIFIFYDNARVHYVMHRQNFNLEFLPITL